jgi:hypothetical protein
MVAKIKKKCHVFPFLILLLKKKLLTAINTLKNGKTKVLDGIMNEIIKNSREMITPCLNMALFLYSLVFVLFTTTCI